MRTFITSVLGALMLVAGSGHALHASDLTVAGGNPGPVYVDSSEILYLESYPVQVQLLVKGSLPTPCHEVVSEVQDLGDSIDVLLWSISGPDMICAAVLEPFESVIPLGSFEIADLPVYLNGEEVGRIEIGAGASASEPALEAAGWSFGFCAGYCVADMTIVGSDLVLTGRSRVGEQPLYTNGGKLTSDGSARLETALADLEGVSPDPVYGCPDCADGGAAYLELSRDGATERIEMEFGNPPDALADLYAISASLIAGLETCQSNELLDVATDCVAYQFD